MSQNDNKDNTTCDLCGIYPLLFFCCFFLTRNFTAAFNFGYVVTACVYVCVTSTKYRVWSIQYLHWCPTVLTQEENMFLRFLRNKKVAHYSYFFFKVFVVVHLNLKLENNVNQQRGRSIVLRNMGQTPTRETRRSTVCAFPRNSVSWLSAILDLLNKQYELVPKCGHENKFFATNHRTRCSNRPWISNFHFYKTEICFHSINSHSLHLSYAPFHCVELAINFIKMESRSLRGIKRSLLG